MVRTFHHIAYILFNGSAPGGYTTFLRSEFHSTILSRLANYSNCYTHTSKRLLYYNEFSSKGSLGITLNFADNTKATCDILIGADGVKSVVRNCMYESPALIAESRGPDGALSLDRREVQKGQDLRSFKAPV